MGLLLFGRVWFHECASVWVCLKRTMISYFWHLSYSQLSIDEIRNWILYFTLPISLSLFSAIQNQIHSQSNSLILDSHSTWTECHNVNGDYPPKLTTSNEFRAFECIHKTTYIDIILFNPFCLFLFVIWMGKSPRRRWRMEKEFPNNRLLK